MLCNYQARTHDGLARAGTVEGASEEAAVQALQRQSLIVISLTLAAPKVAWYDRPFTSFRGVKQREIMLLSRELATLFEAKVPVVQTFRTLIGQSGSGAMRKHLAEVLDDVQGGMSMSQAMAKHPKVFSAFFVNMVRSGEESGR